MIEVRNLSYAYGKTQVLSGVNLTAADGECVAVLGNNGVGKSTLVTCVNRIRTPSELSLIHIFRELRLRRKRSAWQEVLRAAHRFLPGQERGLDG